MNWSNIAKLNSSTSIQKENKNITMTILTKNVLTIWNRY